ncbi:MAG: hypothetical protein JSV81_10375 [Anaerolineales bacterium]|nr:MAG: hypothetical protein JSV81_10375 [Anaerolineales bacterium]
MNREIIGYWESNVGTMSTEGYLYQGDATVDDEVTTHHLVGRDAALCHFNECDITCPLCQPSLYEQAVCDFGACKPGCRVCSEPEEVYCHGMRCSFVGKPSEFTQHGYGHYCPHCMALVRGAK